MTVANWATLFVAISTLVGSFAVAVRFLVKHFLYELRPNGGASLKDSVNRLEAQMEIVLGLLEKK